MTQAEATAAAAAGDTALGEAVATIKYGVFALWSNSYVKNYNIVLYPTTYAAQYAAGTESQQLAFTRVSVATIAAEPTDAADFVTVFNTKAAADTELAAYLGL